MKKIFHFIILAGLILTLGYAVIHFGTPNLVSGNSPLGMDMSAMLLHAQDSDQFVDAVEALGVSSLKISIPWQEVELSAGLFTWSITPQTSQIDLDALISKLDQQGIAVTIVLEGFPSYLQYENLSEESVVSTYLESWQRYVQAVVAQFGDKVDTWQIGSAVNLPFELQGQPIAAAVLASPSTYAERLKIAAAVIKAANSADVVVVGGIVSDTGNCLNQPSAFLQSLNTLDVWDDFDVIGIDLSTYASAPEGKTMYQTYDIVSGACLTSAEGGFNLAEIIALVDGVNSQYGQKPVWITGLNWSQSALNAAASERGTLEDVVRADYLSRATLMLLGSHHVEKIFWQYGDGSSSDSPGVFARQDFSNLTQALKGFRSSANSSDVLNGYYQYRLTTSGLVNIFVWRGYGGDSFQPYTLQNISGYQLEAFSLDADSIKNGQGIDLPVSENGDVRFMLSERPVLVKATPTDIKERFALYTQGMAASMGNSLKKSASGFLDEQKDKAGQQVEDWVDEQKDSLFEALKQSLMDWLKEAIHFNS
ncbi:MAG: hypothetical protein GYA52_13340 [Chloroflexi bacterium]|nr:hypothetical protein [Chloroflexota bacterium]